MKKIILTLGALSLGLTACVGNTGNNSNSTVTQAQVLQDNLNFFKLGAGVDPQTFMPYDTIYVDKTTHQITRTVRQFNTTETGLYLNILLLIAEQKIPCTFITPTQALVQMQTIVNELLSLQTTPGKSWKGLFYWPYQIESDGNITPGIDPTSTQATSTIPDVDNSNLDFSLAAVLGAYQSSSDSTRLHIATTVQQIIDNQTDGWSQIAALTGEPSCPNCIRAGWDTATNQPLGYYIDRKANESRLSPLWALIQGYTSNESSFNQMPLYSNVTTLSSGESITAELTWDGTTFQLFLPRILLREDQLIPNYDQIASNYITVMQNFIESNNVPAFVSASSGVDDNYYSFGVPSLSECDSRGWCTPPSFVNGTPHATALVNLYSPSISNQYFNSLYQCGNTLTPYGLYDAIGQNCQTGTELISLDQGMLVLGLAGNDIANYVGVYLQRIGKWSLVQRLYQSYQPVPLN